ncbi:MAG: PhnE/PtxC family ABC transporter permease [Planctomycetota bacterium]
MTERDRVIASLWRERPQNRFLRASVLAFLVLMLVSWTVGDFALEHVFSARKLGNLDRFLGEIVPEPLRGRGFDLAIAVRWISDMMSSKGWSAALLTLAISVAAIVLAALGSSMLCLPAARSFANPEPYLPMTRSPDRGRWWLWRSVVAMSRALLIFLRAIPEYVWAFLLLAMLGTSAWPGVLALAIHNAGILGKLTAETIEDLETPSLKGLRGLGAGRLQIALFGIFPLTMPRFLLYFFYRFESCVREATVLGMLGILSLGWWIDDARSRFQYDQMLFLVLIGSAIVLAGDLVSACARALVRRAA